MFGAPEGTKQLRQGAEQTGASLLQFLQPGAAQQFLGRTPQLLGGAGEELLGLISGGGQQAGQRVIDAALPGFQQNLRTAQSGAAAQATSPFSSALALQGQDISTRALQDFNLFQAQQLAGGQERAIQAANVLGQLAQTEQGGRLGGLGLATQFFGPIAAERAQQGSGLGNFFGGLLGLGAGAFGGPFLGEAGRRAAGGLFD